MSASPDTSPFGNHLSELSDSEQVTSSTPSVPRIKLKIRLNPTPHSDYDDDDSAKKHKRKRKHHHKKRKHAKERRHSEIVDIDNEGADKEEEDEQNDKYPEYQHMPVGGKRPFALLHQQQQQEDNYLKEKGDQDSGTYDDSQDQFRIEEDEDEEGEDEEEYEYEEEVEEDGEEAAENMEYDARRAPEGLTTLHPTDTTASKTVKKLSRSKTTAKTKPKSKKKSASKQSAKVKGIGMVTAAASSAATKKRGRPTKKAQARASAAHMAATLPKHDQQHGQRQGSLSKDNKKDLKSIFLKLWETLSKRDAYGFFLEPVNTKVVRDYLSVIKRPMDFSTLRHKIENGSYRAMDDFRKDFLLIVQNAKLYNAPDTIYWKSADKLESFGIKAIEKSEKLVQELSAGNQLQQQQSSSFSRFLENRQYSWQQQQRAAYSRKDSTAVKEEEVDILGLDGPVRKPSRVDSERSTRETSLDTQSRAMTPVKQQVQQQQQLPLLQQQSQTKKKKKKKMTDSGVIYGPDGSIHAVGAVDDLRELLPRKPALSDPPQLTTINPQALPSAFYQPNRSIHDDWGSHKHFVQPSVFCDYGPFPFTTLGNSTPAMFYRPQDAQYVYSLYGDDTGEAYLKSVWQFMDDLGLGEKAASISRQVTRGAWDVMATVIDKMDTNTDDIDVDSTDDGHSMIVDTEFGRIDVGSLLDRLKEKDMAVGNERHRQLPLSSSSSEPVIPELANVNTMTTPS